MKILHLSSEKSWRGGEQQIANLIEELNVLGVKSHVAVRKDSEFHKWSVKKNIPFITLSFKNDFDFASAISLNRYCRTEKFDLVHLHSSRGHGIGFLSAILGNKTPMILSRRVDFPLKSNRFSKAKYNHPSIKRILCVSDQIRKIISPALKHPEHCLTVYSGVDLNRFAGKGIKGTIRKELGIDENELLIGNIAALAPHKDYFTFLGTTKILSDKINAKFVIAGDGPLQESIKEKIAELSLADKVFLVGFRNDLENVYADLDLLLYTSKEEGLGTSLLDTMAYGVPIVATEAGGIPEIIINEQTGLTAPVKDSKRLAEQCIRLLNDHDLRNKLIMNAQEFVKKFSKANTAKKTLEIYQEVLKES